MHSSTWIWFHYFQTVVFVIRERILKTWICTTFHVHYSPNLSGEGTALHQNDLLYVERDVKLYLVTHSPLCGEGRDTPSAHLTPSLPHYSRLQCSSLSWAALPRYYSYFRHWSSMRLSIIIVCDDVYRWWCQWLSIKDSSSSSVFTSQMCRHSTRVASVCWSTVCQRRHWSCQYSSLSHTVIIIIYK